MWVQETKPGPFARAATGLTEESSLQLPEEFKKKNSNSVAQGEKCTVNTLKILLNALEILYMTKIYLQESFI